MLRAADLRLGQLRQSVPDAGGLVIASDHIGAKAYAKILERITGRDPWSVLSDDPKASSRIAEFSTSDDRWLVAVRMVSEGVDVPRLAVGVYATSASTPLFFAQAIGRFVRARRPGETASVFLPSVPVLLELASQLEAQRDHILGKPHREKDGWDDELLADANRQKDEPGEEEKAFTALSASAELDQVIYDGSSFGTAAFAGSDEEQEYLGLPGLLEPEQVRDLLRQRQDRAAGGTLEAPGRRAGRTRRRREHEVGGRTAQRPTQGTEHPGGDVPPPHGQAPRHDPQRAAPRLRRPPDGHGHGGTAGRTHRNPPQLVRPSAARQLPAPEQSRVSRWAPASRVFVAAQVCLKPQLGGLNARLARFWARSATFGNRFPGRGGGVASRGSVKFLAGLCAG